MEQPREGEIYIEFTAISGHLKAVAVDANTGIEVTVFGPGTVSQNELQNIAVQKLRRRLAQEAEKEEENHRNRPGSIWA